LLSLEQEEQDCVYCGGHISIATKWKEKSLFGLGFPLGELGELGVFFLEFFSRRPANYFVAIGQPQVCRSPEGDG
jgi:hypothetical protein